MRGVLVVVAVVLAIGVVVGVVAYLRSRLVRAPFPPGRPRRIAGAVLTGSLVVTFGTILIARIASGTALARGVLVGYLMLAVFLYLALALVVLELPRWALNRRAGRDHGHNHTHGNDHAHTHAHAHGGSHPRSDKPAPADHPAGEGVQAEGDGSQAGVDVGRRQTIARILAGTAGVAAVGTTGFGFFQARDIRVRAVTVPMTRPDPAVDGLRIAVLTDVHLTTGLRERSWMAETVERVNRLEVDLVAIVGDLVDGSVGELGDDAAPLADLQATYGAAFVTGNHEYFSGADEWAAHLPTLGVRVLRNERIALERNGGVFDLAGVDDVAGEQYSSGPDFARALDGRDPDRTVILLAHQPVLADEAQDNGVDLQISGHTHGGQLWPIHYLVRLQQGHLAGLERLGDTVLYTSRGVGSWGPPVRVGAPPEISLLTLRAR